MKDIEAKFEAYWSILKILARAHGVYIGVGSTWREPFNAGKNAEQAFYDAFPECKKGE